MNRVWRWLARGATGVLHLLHRAKWVSFPTASRGLALLPGTVGSVSRADWYRRTLDGCGDDLRVAWMAVIKTPRTRVGRNVYVGEFCHIGWAEIGDDVLLGGHITVLSGGRHHGVESLDVPISKQEGELALVKIGSDVWIGNGAIVMADVAPGTVIAAGAVVTRTFAPYSVLAGVPARVLRNRAMGENAAARQDLESS